MIKQFEPFLKKSWGLIDNVWDDDANVDWRLLSLLTVFVVTQFFHMNPQYHRFTGGVSFEGLKNKNQPFILQQCKRSSFFRTHSPIFAKFIRSKMRTWKSLIVQASPWYVDPCSCGLDLQELQKKFCPWTKGGTSVKSFFHCGPPCDSKFENFCSSWRSRPLEHESTHHMEA